ncbi:Protein CBG25550 [Caenorhabditis briggsae]|uniref:Protein CBG25550 n=1 Tax=Caenorhabditis briggsae TaxID=6238 RepID=B6IF37_CAEBR|nr:Protein CBG25550 [Caenorhabditis briggsae]CAR98517.1 Protein CBG25550 [Caenorhabditis briggsae]
MEKMENLVMYTFRVAGGVRIQHKKVFAFFFPITRIDESHQRVVRSARSIDEGVASCDGSSSLTSLRRNAINPDDEGALPDTKRHKKTSYAGRTFDNHEISTAAQSHHIQRTVQPSKCSACDTLSILYTVQCIDSGGPARYKTKVHFF